MIEHSYVQEMLDPGIIIPAAAVGALNWPRDRGQKNEETYDVRAIKCFLETGTIITCKGERVN